VTDIASPRLSIVIVSWNTRELLARCLRSLDVDPETEIFVVDNASADGSAAMVQEQFPGVRLLVNPENLGFARACNQAIRCSSGRYILLLNPDTEVRPGAVAVLARCLASHPPVGAVGARIVNPDGSLQTSCFREPRLSRELWRLLHLDVFWPYAVYRVQNWDLTRPRQVETLLGACLMLRRAALDSIGPLDEDYFIYSEEVDLCLRLRRRGWHLIWAPQAVVMHRGGESTRQVAAAMFVRLYQGKILFFRKHHGRAAARGYKLILAGAALVRLAVAPATRLEPSSRRERHLVLASHYRRLLHALPGL
jgi:GT2 family glycosyltransferase